MRMRSLITEGAFFSAMKAKLWFLCPGLPIKSRMVSRTNNSDQQLWYKIIGDLCSICVDMLLMLVLYSILFWWTKCFYVPCSSWCVHFFWSAYWNVLLIFKLLALLQKKKIEKSQWWWSTNLIHQIQFTSGNVCPRLSMLKCKHTPSLENYSSFWATFIWGTWILINWLVI